MKKIYKKKKHNSNERFQNNFNVLHFPKKYKLENIKGKTFKINNNYFLPVRAPSNVNCAVRKCAWKLI